MSETLINILRTRIQSHLTKEQNRINNCKCPNLYVSRRIKKVSLFKKNYEYYVKCDTCNKYNDITKEEYNAAVNAGLHYNHVFRSYELY